VGLGYVESRPSLPLAENGLKDNKGRVGCGGGEGALRSFAASARSSDCMIERDSGRRTGLLGSEPRSEAPEASVQFLEGLWEAAVFEAPDDIVPKPSQASNST